jgi:hypothetical protein
MLTSKVPKPWGQIITVVQLAVRVNSDINHDQMYSQLSNSETKKWLNNKLLFRQ